MGLNKKDLKLLKTSTENSLLLKDFADLYEESERNIRYRIDNLNYYLKKYLKKEIEIKNGIVYCMVSLEEFELFIDKLEMKDYIFSQDEREKFIVIKYLFQKNTTIKEIQNFFKVSRTTIKKDLKSLELQLANYSLYFCRDKNRIIIGGNEKKLRHLKLLMLLKYVAIEDKKVKFIKNRYFFHKEKTAIIKGYIEKFYTSQISDIIDEIEENFKISFSSEFKNIMNLYLVTTLERINHDYIIDRKNNSEFLVNLEEYKIIKNSLIKIINQKYEFEFFHLTEYFLSGFYNESFSENILIVEGFISRMLEQLETILNKPLLVNRQLGEKLLEYLVPAIYRIKNNFTLNKELKWEIFPENLKKAVIKCVRDNNRYLDEPLRDEEIYNIVKILERYIPENINTISLKELITLVQKHTVQCNINELAQDLITNFENIIEDDRTVENDYGILYYLNASNIKIVDEKITFHRAMEIGMETLFKNRYIKDQKPFGLTDFIEKFGRYMFLEKRVLFYYDKNKNNCIASSLAMIVSKEGIEVDGGENGNILFILSTKNKIEHLKIISELIYLLENRQFMWEIIKAEDSHKITDIISGYLSIK